MLDEELEHEVRLRDRASTATGHDGRGREAVPDATPSKRRSWYDKLQHVVDAYVSPEWTTAAIARQGSLYDSLRTGLYNTRPPELKMFDAKTEAL